MSLNPPLSEPLREPLPRMLEEVYVLRRDGCNVRETGFISSFRHFFLKISHPRLLLQLEMQLNGAPVERTGTIYLTSLRIVFVCDRPEEKFWGLDIPLATTPDADFNQPIFGANNLTGTAEPVRFAEAKSSSHPTLFNSIPLYFVVPSFLTSDLKFA